MWRNVRGPFDVFGHARNAANSPVPTVLPALDLSLPANQLQLVALHNGYAVKTSDGRRLGGAEGFQACWSGVLLIEHEGEYEFHAGAPTPRGGKTRLRARRECCLASDTQTRPENLGRALQPMAGRSQPWRRAPLEERRRTGITIEFKQPAPDFSVESHVRPQHTGFEVKYSGPDSDAAWLPCRFNQLYRDFQNQTLAAGITFFRAARMPRGS